MKIEFDKLNQDARIWIYQNHEAIAEDKVGQIKQEIGEFVSSWSAHQRPLAAFGDVFHNRFVVLIVDETYNQASGCSIDASVTFVRSLEKRFDLQLFDRFTFSYEKDGQIHTVPKSEFAALYQAGEIDYNTLVFDNLIRTKADLLVSWQKPLGHSWLKRFVQSRG
ncbi:MAG: hypothetical protein HKN76_02470 [Saprospiraceae bacterium]|nr:hypothetical protein [Saprospiraceae bacterium]